jgi:hypothetical protein
MEPQLHPALLGNNATAVQLNYYAFRLNSVPGSREDPIQRLSPLLARFSRFSIWAKEIFKGEEC